MKCPLSLLVKSMGAISIDRAPRNGETDRKSFVDSMVTLFIENEELVIVCYHAGGNHAKMTVGKQGFIM